MKYIFIATILIILSSCSKIYHHYDVINNTTEEIYIEIETFGGEYQKHLSYNIIPGEREFVFEHIHNENTEIKEVNFSKYIKSIKITTAKTKMEISKKFTVNNLHFKNLNGFLGDYYVWEFVINQSDLDNPLIEKDSILN